MRSMKNGHGAAKSGEAKAPGGNHSPQQIQAMDEVLAALSPSSQRPLVVFLGAGASKPFGYPVTRDLMLMILRGLLDGTILAKTGKGPGTRPLHPREELRAFLLDLLPGERATRETVPMVTAVLSLLDYSLATGQAVLPGRTLDDTRQARQLLERALLEVIPDFEWFEDAEEQKFETYCNWLSVTARSRPPGGLGIITTNYDMVADVAAFRVANVEEKGGSRSLPDVANKVDFGFRWVRPDRDEEEILGRPTQPRLSLLKLHGSTNWLRCPLCENLYIHPDGPISWRAFEPRKSWNNQCHCSPTRLQAQIVSPSFVREMREPNLIAVWKNALDLLRQAKQWVIIGYGFPDEDVGIRALFTRAFGSKQSHPQVFVIQLDDSARLNYESFFPAGSVRYLTGGLDLLLERWAATKRARSARRGVS